MKTRLIHRTPGQDKGGPVALVTGAAGAMGAAITLRLSRLGMTVVLVDRAGEGASSVVREAGISSALVIEADLSQQESPREVVDLVRQHAGRIDHVVNNAGLNRAASIFDVTVGDWDAVMAVNLRAPMLLCQACIPLWESGGGGSIVNIGSRVWLSGSLPAYTASKAGLVGLTRSFAVELARLNVRANAVAPSFVDTAFTRQTRTEQDIAQRTDRALSITPLGRLGTAEDIANAVAFLVSADASFITGEVLHVCGGAQLASQVHSFAQHV